jgi:hypothetical protein
MRPVELVHTSASQRRSNRTSKGRFIKRRDAGIKLTVTTRRQTPQEAREFTAAFSLLVADIVSYELRHVRRKT